MKSISSPRVTGCSIFINGTLMSDVTDEDSGQPDHGGYLGMQVNVGSPMQVALQKHLI